MKTVTALMPEFKPLQKAARKWALHESTQSYKGLRRSEVIAPIVLMCLVLFIGTLTGITYSGSGLVLAGLAAGVTTMSLLGISQFSRRRHRREAMEQKYPTDIATVVEYLRHKIGQEEEAQLGEESPLRKLLARLEALYAEAQALQRKLRQQTGRDARETVNQGLQDAHEAEDSVRASLAELRKHMDQLRAFFTAALCELDQLINPESCVNLAQKARELKSAARGAAAEVEDARNASLLDLSSRLATLQTSLGTLLEESGVRQAAALPSSGDAAQDLARIADVVSSYTERAGQLNIHVAARQEV